MKIIRPGDINKARERYAFECRACGCKFECEGDETKKVEYRETLYMHGCPCCGESVYGKPCGEPDAAQ